MGRGLISGRRLLSGRPGLRAATRWTVVIPVLAAVLFAVMVGADAGAPLLAVAGVLLAGSVLAAVHHAEVVAHRVGEPLGSLILAVAVTVIEVGLIVVLMLSAGDEPSTLARDTVFAAVMITCNGIVGLALLIGAFREGVASFRPEGVAPAQAVVVTLATLCLVLPTFTATTPEPRFSTAQLVFAASASVVLYALFVVVQTVRHRDYFLPPQGSARTTDQHADPPTATAAIVSVALLIVALVAVVGLAKVQSGSIEDLVDALGAPQSAIGVVIALLILLPEMVASARNARRGRVQISLNLAFGSAIASIGLTIPAIAIATIWLDAPLVLGLGGAQIVLLALTVIVGALAAPLGEATVLQAGVRLTLFAAFLFLAFNP